VYNKILRSWVIWLCCYSTLVFAEAVVGKDPTEPYSASQETTTGQAEDKANTSLVLGAVFISGGEKFAIINNKLVKVGDTVGTSKVKTIDSYHVTLVGETGDIELALFGRSIKELAK
jgi:hypothetical protein